MILAQKELQHAVITSDTLELLKKLSTLQEWKDIKKLKVETAVFYSKGDRLNTIEEWTDHVLSDQGSLHYDVDQQTPVDTRTQAWCSLPLSGFVGALLDKRAEIKQSAALNQQYETNTS